MLGKSKGLRGVDTNRESRLHAAPIAVIIFGARTIGIHCTTTWTSGLFAEVDVSPGPYGKSCNTYIMVRYPFDITWI